MIVQRLLEDLAARVPPRLTPRPGWAPAVLIHGAVSPPLMPDIDHVTGQRRYRCQAEWPAGRPALDTHRPRPQRLLLLQQDGRTHPGIERDHVHLLLVIDDDERGVKRA